MPLAALIDRQAPSDSHPGRSEGCRRRMQEALVSQLPSDDLLYADSHEQQIPDGHNVGIQYVVDQVCDRFHAYLSLANRPHDRNDIPPGNGVVFHAVSFVTSDLHIVARVDRNMIGHSTITPIKNQEVP